MNNITGNIIFNLLQGQKEPLTDKDLELYELILRNIHETESIKSLNSEIDFLKKNFTAIVKVEITTNSEKAVISQKYSALEDMLNNNLGTPLKHILSFNKLTFANYKKIHEYPTLMKFLFQHPNHMLKSQIKNDLLREIISAGDEKALEDLLKFGALTEIKTTDKYKKLPLLNLAIIKKSPEMVKLLLYYQAEATKEQIELAFKIGESKILNLFESVNLNSQISKINLEDTLQANHNMETYEQKHIIGAVSKQHDNI